MKSIILASTSPRRKEILERFGVKFRVIPSEIEEKFNALDDPIEVVKTLSLNKCIDVAKKCKKGDIIIAADTIVYYNSILGKPKNRKDAFKILKNLSGKTHKVITGIAVIDLEDNRKIVEHEVTHVKFRDLNDKKIETYLDTEEYIDKAGAYGIQGYGEILVESIKGNFSNVVGLPIYKLDVILEGNFNLSLL